jgi:hypothetical protein
MINSIMGKKYTISKYKQSGIVEENRTLKT